MLTRRTFLNGLAVAGIGAAAPVYGNPAYGSGGSRALTLYNVWSKETATFLLGRNEAVSGRMQRQINHFLRDHHNGYVGRMDPSLIRHMMDIQEVLELDDKVFHVLSAYRSKKTNRMLRKRGAKVATYSMHLQGRAIDIKLPNTNNRDLRDAALDLRVGGVGYYGAFVHVDTGSVRRW